MNYYRVVVTNHPSDKQKKDGKKTEVVLDVNVMAANREVAILRAKKDIVKPYCFHLDNLAVGVTQLSGGHF